MGAMIPPILARIRTSSPKQARFNGRAASLLPGVPFPTTMAETVLLSPDPQFISHSLDH